MRWFALLLVLALSPLMRAADPPKALALVPKDGLAFVSLNAAEAWDHPALRGFRDALVKSAGNSQKLKEIGLGFPDIERFTAVMLEPRAANDQRQFEPEVLFLVGTRKPFDQARVIKGLKLYGIEEAKELEKTWKPDQKRPEPGGKTGAAFYVGPEMMLAFPDNRTLAFWPHDRIGGKPGDLTNPLDRLKSAAATGPLAEGLDLAAKHPVAVGLNTIALKNASANDPPPDDFAPLLRADAVFGFGQLSADKAEFKLTAKFAGQQWAADGEEAAKKLKDLTVFSFKDGAKRTVKREGDDSPLGAFLAVAVDVMEKATLKLDGTTVTAAAAIDLGPKTQKLLAALPGATSEAAQATMSLNNLKQIVLAWHNYHDVNGRGLTNIHSKDGKPLLSWRVHLLPYMEQDQLYKQFKLDEPWDSDNNKKLIEKMPKVFEQPGVKTKEAGLTHYRGFEGKKNAQPRPLFQEGDVQGLGIVGVTDGTSNTYFCVTAEEPVTWTKPEDLPFDPNGPLPKFGQFYAKGQFQAAMCDGSVRSVRANLPAATLKAYITANGGEVVADDD